MTPIATGFLPAVFFYLFAGVTLFSALMVIVARNPVHCVLFLILAFVNSSGLFLLAGAEFLALLLIVVYVGAVAVLFLFVVMMLDIDFVELREGFLRYLPVAGAVGLVVLAELLIVLVNWPQATGETPQYPAPDVEGIPNVQALGDVLYTDFVFFFQIAGMILLVAMIATILLTLRKNEKVRRQDIARQTERTPETSIETVEVESGKGI